MEKTRYKTIAVTAAVLLFAGAVLCSCEKSTAHEAPSAEVTEKADGTAPAKSADKTASAKQADETDPAKQSDGTDPAKQADGTDPAKQSDGADPAKQADGMAPAQAADGASASEVTDVSGGGSSASAPTEDLSAAASQTGFSGKKGSEITSEMTSGQGKEKSDPILLDYIDAWNEWHTMEVNPAVRKNQYDPALFVFGEGDPQWTSYNGMKNASAGTDVSDGSVSASAADTAAASLSATDAEEPRVDTAAASSSSAAAAEGSRQYECLQGVDVSEHQGTIDWNAVAEAGYSFAFIRVGYRGYGEAGNIYEDAAAVDNLQNAKAAGLKVGAYFFSQALSEEEAVQEAQVAAQVLQKADVRLDLPLMYDPEIIKDDWGRANNITREQVTLNTAAFREEAQRLCDCKVDIYSNLPWEHEYFDGDTMNSYDIWYADYEKLPQTPYHFTWWQYTNQGNVPGISGHVDLNLWIR